ncbi:hypothetical protein [Pseudoclavibacter sp. 8L]|uniref:hypothetical protein n=1 Tax=Pseudoclavibacter sp. 8L TaxID=2653162 RepID=UPI0012F029FF|nr:hypothetical protein [Pseudoclavibacter sp. 8L]VXB75868.1 conserved hypothetical protein [Pseudoclavibacter sp. 8L]
MSRISKLTCAERDAALLDKSTGRPSDDWCVYSSLTDISGMYGEPRIETTWQMKHVLSRGITDVRHPAPLDHDGRSTGEDVRPCEHYLVDLDEDDS